MSANTQNIESAFGNEQKKLTGFVRNQVGTQEDAEDIVQDVFESLVGGFDDLLDVRKAVSWMYAVAKNKIIDFLRKKKTYAIEDQRTVVHDEEESFSLMDLIPSSEVLPDNQMMQDLIWDKIQVCLDELPEEQRDVFVWHELEGRSFQMIAETTGVSVSTLISRKRYAVVFLREELKELFELMKS